MSFVVPRQALASVLPSKWKAHMPERESFKVAKEKLRRGQHAIAESPVGTLSTFKDLPRMIQRCVVKDAQSNIVFGTDEGSTAGPLSRIVQLVRVLEEQLGELTPQEIMETSQRLQDIADSAGNADMQLTVSNMFEVIGTESRVANLLKFVSQSVTLCAVSFLKSTLTKRYMTKDVRSSDGWRVIISFEQAQARPFTSTADNVVVEDLHHCSEDASRFPQSSNRMSLFRQGRLRGWGQKTRPPTEDMLFSEPSICVSHVRKEQSMDLFGDSTEHFEFTWDVLLRLELTSLALREVQLHVGNLHFDAASMPKSKGRSLRRHLATRRVV